MIKVGLSISGISDFEPAGLCHVNEHMCMKQENAWMLSPCLCAPIMETATS
jgi:hypothetical protein